MNLFSKIFHSGVTEKEDTKEKGMKEIEAVVDKLAYKYSIPQGIIRNIIWTWMQYERKRLYNFD